MLKNPHAKQALWEIPQSGISPGEENGTHPVILAGEIPWAEEPDRLPSPWGSKESDSTERLSMRARVSQAV